MPMPLFDADVDARARPGFKPKGSRVYATSAKMSALHGRPLENPWLVMLYLTHKTQCSDPAPPLVNTPVADEPVCLIEVHGIRTAPPGSLTLISNVVKFALVSGNGSDTLPSLNVTV